MVGNIEEAIEKGKNEISKESNKSADVKQVEINPVT